MCPGYSRSIAGSRSIRTLGPRSRSSNFEKHRPNARRRLPPHVQPGRGHGFDRTVEKNWARVANFEKAQRALPRDRARRRLQRPEATAGSLPVTLGFVCSWPDLVGQTLRLRAAPSRALRMLLNAQGAGRSARRRPRARPESKCPNLGKLSGIGPRGCFTNKFRNVGILRGIRLSTCLARLRGPR